MVLLLFLIFLMALVVLLHFSLFVEIFPKWLGEHMRVSNQKSKNLFITLFYSSKARNKNYLS